MNTYTITELLQPLAFMLSFLFLTVAVSYIIFYKKYNKLKKQGLIKY